jgi:hypothetical protein
MAHTAHRSSFTEAWAWYFLIALEGLRVPTGHHSRPCCTERYILCNGSGAWPWGKVIPNTVVYTDSSSTDEHRDFVVYTYTIQMGSLSIFLQNGNCTEAFLDSESHIILRVPGRFTFKTSISLWFVYVYRRRLGEYVPNLLTKFIPVRGLIRYFHTFIDVDFPSVANLLTKFNPVQVDFSLRAQKSDSVLLKLAEIRRNRIRFLRPH